jgi:hypothetical protein
MLGAKERTRGRSVPLRHGFASNFPRIEITGIFALNISSFAHRRNNSPTNETIFRFSRRHPETVAN